jgi:S1-C subfamily serine protease
VTIADVLLLVWVGLFAVSGFFRGFAGQLLSLTGVVAGALIGAWLAPHLLPDVQRSPWVPAVSLAGALTGAFAFGFAAGQILRPAQRYLAERPALRVADRVGGAAAGASIGIALAWLGAVLFLYQSALGLRAPIQDSVLIPALVRVVPPEPVLRALSRFDPFPVLPSVVHRLPAPDPSILRSGGGRAAATSVVKIEGTSCGLGVQGSGWVVRPGLVATNAHVIAGQVDTRVLPPGGRSSEATVVYVDGGNDVAFLRVRGLPLRPLPIARDTSFPAKVTVLGYPRDGPLVAFAGTAGAPRTIIAVDAYGGRLRPRLVMPLRGHVQPGESGGPVVDRRGRVLAMVFGGTRRGQGGFAVPIELVTRGLPEARGAVSPGPCLG